MRRKLIVSILIMIVCIMAAGIGAEDQPEKRVMNYLAVMDLNCGKVVSKDNCAVLTDIVIDELVKLKQYTVIDRANRDKILSETGFQMTGCVDDSCTIEAGRILGVGKIVVGKVSKLGQTYIVGLQLLNVETAAVEHSSRDRCKKCELDNLIDTTMNAARKLMGEKPLPTKKTSPPPSEVSSEPTSKPKTFSCTGISFSYGSHEYCGYKENLPWLQAKMRCEAYGGHLVTIANGGENLAVLKVCKTMKDVCWIGFTDEHMEGYWQWVTNEPITYTNWAFNSPDDFGSEDYAFMRKSGKWNDITCKLNLFINPGHQFRRPE